jgi:hypothetical protein
MSIESIQNNNSEPTDLPEWENCDWFCIHDYAGTGSSNCGWRGRSEDARRDPANLRFLCPRCGCATLLRIPPGRMRKAES